MNTVQLGFLQQRGGRVGLPCGQATSRFLSCEMGILYLPLIFVLRTKLCVSRAQWDTEDSCITVLVAVGDYSGGVDNGEQDHSDPGKRNPHSASHSDLLSAASLPIAQGTVGSIGCVPRSPTPYSRPGNPGSWNSLSKQPNSAFRTAQSSSPGLFSKLEGRFVGGRGAWIKPGHCSSYYCYPTNYYKFSTFKQLLCNVHDSCG